MLGKNNGMMPVGLALIAAAFVAFAGAARPALADDALTVVGGSNPSAFFEVLGDVAERAGFYKAEHLTVTVQYAGSPNIAAQAVATGKGDIFSGTTEPIIQGYQRGLRLQAFFARDPHYEYVLAVLDDSPIHTLAGFKGATLGETSAGSPGEIAANSSLMGAGLRNTDVSYLPLGGGTQPIVAITGKQVTGLVLPFVQDVIYVVDADLKFRYFWDPILKDIGDVGYASTPQFIAANADKLQRFSRANAEAAVLIRENPALAARYFLEVSGQRVTDESLRNETRILTLAFDQLPGFDPLSKTIGLMPVRDTTVLAKFLYDNGLTSQIVPASAVVTGQFITFANAFDHKALIVQAKAMH
jgi:NitT/TauT family transport system substrate-binding protein